MFANNLNYFKKLKNSTKKRLLMLCVLTFITFVFTCSTCVLIYKRYNLHGKKQQILTEIHKKQKLLKKLILDKSPYNTNSFDSQTESVIQALKQKFQIQILLNNLEYVAKQNGTSLQDIHSEEYVKNDKFHIHKYRITASCEYLQSLYFLTTIVSAHFSPFVMIEELDLKTEPENSNDSQNHPKKLLLNMLCSVYENTTFENIATEKLAHYINKKTKVNNIEKSKQLPHTRIPKNPFMPPKIKSNIVYNKPTGVKFWPIESLHLVGILEIQTKKIGFIKDPNNDIYLVLVGDKIGIEHLAIISINNTEIILEGYERTMQL